MTSTGVVLAVLQLAFALTWIIYVIYLPALAAQAGIPKEYIPWILLMDQVIFIACDWAAGIYADRLLGIVGRIGPRIAMVTLVSTAAFLALPWIAPMGSVSLFIALTVLWSATSSALRAPPLVLLGKHAAAPQRPWLVGLYLFGVGVAGAASPYLGSALRGVDPVVPFALSAITVFELQTGVGKCSRPTEEAARLRKFTAPLHELAFDSPAAREAAEIRAALEKSGNGIGPFDTLIAGHARCLGLTLVTANTREFSRVQDLALENWQRP